MSVQFAKIGASNLRSQLTVTFFVQCCALFHLGHGIHLSNSISVTALDMAQTAGVNAEDITPAILGESAEEADAAGGEEPRNIEQSIPLITDTLKMSSVPVLPLCCSIDSEDARFYRCGGSSVSAENVNENKGKRFRKKWKAPAKLVSTKVSTEFR